MSTANVEYNGEYNAATPRSKSQPQSQFRHSSQSPPISLPPPPDNRKGLHQATVMLVT